jgi:2-polyprenyl-3-methyl-5-hydroxy-6-metoxy-1,4-benzoquinol methylase
LNDQIKYTGDEVLDIMSQYAVNRNNYIFKLLHGYLPEKAGNSKYSILEFGAGKGEFIDRFHKRPDFITHTIELEPEYISKLAEKHITTNSIDNFKTQFDVIYTIDVLEHIEDDSIILKKINNSLKKDGLLLVYVPARMELFSDFDKKIGHYRRYHKKELEKKLKNAGFEIQKIYYHEFLGYLSVYFSKLSNSEGKLNIKMVKVYDKLIVPLTNFLERMVHPPIGKSLFVVARKK